QALLIVLAAWAAGALVGGFVAGSVSALHKRGAALTVGFVVLVMVVINIAMIPHPTWMAAAGVLVPRPFAWLGGRWALWAFSPGGAGSAGRRRAAGPPPRPGSSAAVPGRTAAAGRWTAAARHRTARPARRCGRAWCRCPREIGRAHV